MDFKNKVVKYFKEHDITVNRVEQESDLSIVCHVPQSDNVKIANIKDVMEKVLDVVVVQSDMFGMNVVVVESNDLDGEDNFEPTGEK